MSDQPRTEEYWTAELSKAFAETEREVIAQMLADPALPPEKEAALRKALSMRTAAPDMLAALKEILSLPSDSLRIRLVAQLAVNKAEEFCDG